MWTGADVNAKDKYGESAVVWGATEAHWDIVTRLLAAGASTKSTNEDKENLLTLAVIYGEVEDVEAMIAAGVPLNGADSKGWTPLVRAMRAGYTDMVSVLVNAGASLAKSDSNGWTPLHWAASLGTLPLVQMLLNAGAPVAPLSNDGQTPHDVAGSLEVKLFLERGHGLKYPSLVSRNTHAAHQKEADLTLRRDHDHSVRAMRAQPRPQYEVELLDELSRSVVAHGEEYNQYLQPHGHNDPEFAHASAPHPATAQTRGSGVDKTLSARLSAAYARSASVTASAQAAVTKTHVPGSNLSLAEAAALGRVDVIYRLLDEGEAADEPDEDSGWTPLHFAAEKGHLAAVQALTQPELVDVNLVGDPAVTPISLASANGHWEVVEVLVGAGADLAVFDHNDECPLSHAARANDYIHVKYLAQLGSPVDVQDTKGMSPLHWAAVHGNIPLVRFLVSSGLGVNDTDDDKWTVLHHAAHNDHPDLVAWLLRHGGSGAASKRNRDGYTPGEIGSDACRKAIKEYVYETKLVRAAEDAQNEVVRHLVGVVSVDPNAANKAGNTPLLYAVMYENLELAHFLLAHGADPSVMNKEGRTPLWYAAQYADPQFTLVLSDALIRGHSESAAKLASVYVQDYGHTDGRALAYMSDNDHDVYLYLRSAPSQFAASASPRRRAPGSSAAPLDEALMLNPPPKIDFVWTSQLIDYLMSDRKSMNVKDSRGETPLFFAARASDAALVQEMLLRGASASTRSSSSQTPADVATSSRIIDLLLASARDPAHVIRRVSEQNRSRRAHH